MYHLIVSGTENTWEDTSWDIYQFRCLSKNEYTHESLAVDFAALTPEKEDALLAYPCVFAYETGCKSNARLGRITRIRQRGKTIRLDFQLTPDYPEIRSDDLVTLKWELDIAEWELSRTHWALKNEDLSCALAGIGYPAIGEGKPSVIDIFSHTFDVALSFPGEVREYVHQVASNLVTRIGKANVFYDSFYKAQLARPNLDTALQSVYRDHSRLIVAFLSQDYATKKWCHIEFRAIREIINKKADDKVMFVRHDGAEIRGTFSTDGYIDAEQHNPIEIADMVIERLQIIKMKEAPQDN